LAALTERAANTSVFGREHSLERRPLSLLWGLDIVFSMSNKMHFTAYEIIIMKNYCY